VCKIHHHKKHILTMKFTDEFEKREWLGRQATSQLSIFKKHKLVFEPNQYSCYDASFHIYDTDTHQIKMRYFIEIKTRDKIYPQYILEKKKVVNIHNKMNQLGLQPGEYKILYLNFTPNQTLLWDITELSGEDCTDKMMMNKATSTSRKHKIDKLCKMMKPEDAKVYDYIINETKIIRNEKLRSIMPEIENVIKEEGFGFLFNK